MGVRAKERQDTKEKVWRIRASREDLRFAVMNPDIALALFGQPLFSPENAEEGAYVGSVTGVHLKWQLISTEETISGAWSVLIAAVARFPPVRASWRLDLSIQADGSGMRISAVVRPISERWTLWLRPGRLLWTDAIRALVERLVRAAERLTQDLAEDLLEGLHDPDHRTRLREHLETRRAVRVTTQRFAGSLSFLEVAGRVMIRFQTSVPRPRRGQEILQMGSQEQEEESEELAHAFERLAQAGNAFTTVRGEEERRALGRDLHERMVQMGRRLYQIYVPKETHGHLTSLLDARPREPLSVEADGALRALPWELLHNGEDFLSLLIPMARTPVQAVKSPRLQSLSSINRVLLALPEDDLDEAIAEVREIHRALSEDLALDVEVLSGGKATKERVLEALQGGKFDAFHYSGHSRRGERAGAGHLLLSEGRRLRADELRRFVQGSPLKLVFLNSCGSAVATGASTALVGLADAFVQNGVPCVVGMRWPISDRGARILALTFYRALVETGDPAWALRETRLAVGTGLDWEDPAWAAPLLYLA